MSSRARFVEAVSIAHACGRNEAREQRAAIRPTSCRGPQRERGGYRVITFFGGESVPVFLLDVYGKGQRAHLSNAEKNALAKLLPKIPAAYRLGSKAAAEKLKNEGRLE